MACPRYISPMPDVAIRLTIGETGAECGDTAACWEMMTYELRTFVTA